MLKEMIERKRRNDFVRKREFDMLRKLRRNHGSAIVFITHDMGVVAQVCDRVAVLYAGRLAETRPAGALFAAALGLAVKVYSTNSPGCAPPTSNSIGMQLPANFWKPVAPPLRGCRCCKPWINSPTTPAC